ncbi:beta-1,4-glucuronyltransferase 1-like isoform X1 [Montipora foliosa]|uniref:beta-1,4-glucuronyltransferase 1-like isoform X1 n=1 Tax=Montipora foliosa TaxID=591990 RepID=UPI0035F12651
MIVGKVSVLLFLSFLVAVLVFVNVVLYSKLQYQERFNGQEKLITPNILEDLLSTQRDFNNLPVDSSGQYKIQTNFFLSKIHQEKGQEDVTLVTHCTSNHLHYLLDLSVHWKGPISLAVFVPGYDVASSYESLVGLYQCDQRFKEHVTVHLVYPLSNPPAATELVPALKQALGRNRNCDDFFHRLRNNHLNKPNYANGKLAYPNNLLRNVGRSSVSPGHYVFVVDVDMMCNGDLYQSFLQLAQRLNLSVNKKDKRVFVVATFESKRKLSPSLTKQELLDQWNRGNAQPFYYQACWKCQRHLDYDAWKSYHSASEDLEIAYTVKWKDPWEPFYFAPNHVPLYDERFKQYGFNRISQVCETHIAGYDFAVLNNAFLIHHGFKIKEGFHSSKDEENARNRELFRTFKQELKLKYPESNRHC